MAWSSSNRRASLPKDWPAIRQRVIKRDQGVCQWPLPFGGKCANPANEVDHKKNAHNHGLDNLWLLCTTHHERKTQTEALAGRTRYEPKRINRYEHPNSKRSNR